MTRTRTAVGLSAVELVDGERRLALLSARWLRGLDVLKRDFGPVPVYLGAGGKPRVFVVGGGDRVAVLFAAVSETLQTILPGRRACEVVGHPAFGSGSRNGELRFVEATTAAAPGQRAEALVLTFGLPLRVTGTRSLDELLRREPQNGMPKHEIRSVPGGCAR